MEDTSTFKIPVERMVNSELQQYQKERREEIRKELMSFPEQKQSALATQVAGAHYKDKAIQPVEYIHANSIGYFEGNVIKYVTRWRQKNGIADLLKAIHYIQLLIELEEKQNASPSQIVSHTPVSQQSINTP